MKDESKTLIQSNSLLEAKHSFNLVELKILLMAIAKIKREDEDFGFYRIYTAELRDISAIKSNNAYYKYLRQISRSLRRKEVEIETEHGHLITGYFSDIELYKNHGYIDFYISPKMKPYLLQLQRSFTIYDIRNVINCKSVYSIRLYQLLKQYEKIGQRSITVKDLKFILGLDLEQYPRWNNFRSRILEITRKELKKYSDIYFEYETKRQGRLIHKVIFTIKKQRQKRLFDNEDFIKNEAVVSYQKPADETLKRLEQEGRESVPMPKELKAKIRKTEETENDTFP
jgi:plasmid replication initiation protein